MGPPAQSRLAGLAVAAAILLYFREKRVAQPLLPVTLLQIPRSGATDALACRMGALFRSLIAFVRDLSARGLTVHSAAEIG